MSSKKNSQTTSNPEHTNGKADASQRPSAVIQMNLPHIFKNEQNQQLKQQNHEETELAQNGVTDQQVRSPARDPTPIVLSELTLNPPPWPAGRFPDADPAIAHMVDILQSFDTRSVKASAIEDIIVIPTADEHERNIRPFAQLYRRSTSGGRHYNFLHPRPDRPKEIMGKVDFSKVGLTIIIQALRAIVSSYEETIPIPPLSQMVDRLNAEDDAMDYRRPRDYIRVHYARVNPFTPEGVRTAVAVLQAAIRQSSSGYAVFHASTIDCPALERQLFAFLELRSMIGWSD